MKRKLKLDLDTLTVDSYVVGDVAPEKRGTVVGAGLTEPVQIITIYSLPCTVTF